MPAVFSGRCFQMFHDESQSPSLVSSRQGCGRCLRGLVGVSVDTLQRGAGKGECSTAHPPL